MKTIISSNDNVLIPQHFGSLLYVRSKHEYVPYDHLTTAILKFCTTSSLRQLPERLLQNVTAAQLKAFGKVGQKMGFLDRKQRFVGKTIDRVPPKDFLMGPLTIHLSITRECDLACRHCFAALEMADAHEQPLNFAELDTLFADAASLGCMRVALTGGEPLNRPDIFKIMDMVSDHGLDVCITSNGTRIDQKITEELNRRPFGWINISLEGATAATNDAIRGKGSFELVVGKLKKHFRHRLTFGLSITLNKLNMHEVELFPQLARKVGAEVVLLRNMYPIGRGASNQSLALTFAEYRKAVEEISKLHKKTFMVPTSCEPVDSDIEAATIYDNFGCAAGNSVATVYPDGKVSPCSLIGDGIELGCLREKSFADIWQNGRGFTKIRALSTPDACLSCHDYQTCSGGCRARAWAVHGDISSADPWCKKAL